jgi:hypothetical protein
MTEKPRSQKSELQDEIETLAERDFGSAGSLLFYANAHLDTWNTLSSTQAILNKISSS